RIEICEVEEPPAGERRRSREVDVVRDDDEVARREVVAHPTARARENDDAAAGSRGGPDGVRDEIDVAGLVVVVPAGEGEYARVTGAQRSRARSVSGNRRRSESGERCERNVLADLLEAGDRVDPAGSEDDGDVVRPECCGRGLRVVHAATLPEGDARSSTALAGAGDCERRLRATVVQVPLEDRDELGGLPVVPRGDGRADLGDVRLNGGERSRPGRGASGNLRKRRELLAFERLRLVRERIQLRGRDGRAEFFLRLREPVRAHLVRLA